MSDWINKKYFDEQNMSDLQWKFSEARPFKHVFLDNFLKEERAKKLANALKKGEFEKKEADLFQFSQTINLTFSENKIIADFREFVEDEEFSDFMRKLTGIPVKPGAIDLSGTLYEDTDYLLCHDDRVEDRKIAYILYLCEDFSTKDGGSFNLIGNNWKKPADVAKRISPKFNRLMLFEVSDISFHEVEEVIGKKKRYAIGGWLH
jgi:prolyl 3-hydroxylase /prolyl 3,4-dihydroxylase